mgnify:CR=1 FL=1
MGVPMRVLAVLGPFEVRAEAFGQARRVNTMLLEAAPAPGDHLAVHMGRAIAPLTRAEAEAAWEALAELFAEDDVDGDLSGPGNSA